MRRDCRRCRVEQSGQQNAESDPQFGCLASSVPVCSRCSSQEQFQLLLQTGLPKNSKGQMASTSKRARFGPRIPPPQIPRNTGAYFDGSHLLPSPKLYSTSVPMLCVAWPMVSLREAPSGAKLQNLRPCLSGQGRRHLPRRSMPRRLSLPHLPKLLRLQKCEMRKRYSWRWIETMGKFSWIFVTIGRQLQRESVASIAIGSL